MAAHSPRRPGRLSRECAGVGEFTAPEQHGPDQVSRSGGPGPVRRLPPRHRRAARCRSSARPETVSRTPGGADIRKRAPGATAQPACSSRVTAPVSSGTGTQTFIPLRPWASTPRPASARISAVAPRDRRSRRPPAGRPRPTPTGGRRRVAAAWLTQPGPSRCRPGTRSTVSGVPGEERRAADRGRTPWRRSGRGPSGR